MREFSKLIGWTFQDDKLMVYIYKRCLCVFDLLFVWLSVTDREIRFGLLFIAMHLICFFFRPSVRSFLFAFPFDNWNSVQPSGESLLWIIISANALCSFLWNIILESRNQMWCIQLVSGHPYLSFKGRSQRFHLFQLEKKKEIIDPKHSFECDSLFVFILPVWLANIRSQFIFFAISLCFLSVFFPYFFFSLCLEVSF